MSHIREKNFVANVIKTDVTVYIIFHVLAITQRKRGYPEIKASSSKIDFQSIFKRLMYTAREMLSIHLMRFNFFMNMYTRVQDFKYLKGFQ